MLTHRRGDFSLCLPISPHDTPYIFIHPTSSWQPHQPTTYDAEPIRTIGLVIRIPYFNSFRLLLCHSNHSAFNSHNFPRTYTTTYLFSILLCHSNRHAPTRGAYRFGNYHSRLLSFLWPYSQPSFMLSFSSPPVIGLFRCRFSSGLCTTPCGITRHPSCHCVSVYSAYLPGLHSARPSAFVEGAGFEPAMSQISRCHLAVGNSSLPSSSRPTFQICLS